jgi:hypothetical protein
MVLKLSDEALAKIIQVMLNNKMITQEQAHRTNRMVIDLQAGGPPVIYLQMYGESSILDQIPALLPVMFGRESDATSETRNAADTPEPHGRPGSSAVPG